MKHLCVQAGLISVECVDEVGQVRFRDIAVGKAVGDEVFRRQCVGIVEGMLVKIMQEVRDIRVVVEVAFDLGIDGEEFNGVEAEFLCHVG